MVFLYRAPVKREALLLVCLSLFFFFPLAFSITLFCVFPCFIRFFCLFFCFALLRIALFLIFHSFSCFNLAGDIAAFTSRTMIEGLGLTTSELMLARINAIKHAGKRDKPARLVDLITRFGLDFLTLTSLTAEQAQALRSTSTDRCSNSCSSLRHRQRKTSQEVVLALNPNCRWAGTLLESRKPCLRADRARRNTTLPSGNTWRV